jgi:CRISPR/Cas system CSM-associated protein Csm4 (group 5 of RAMP superfamily)
MPWNEDDDDPLHHDLWKSEEVIIADQLVTAKHDSYLPLRVPKWGTEKLKKDTDYQNKKYKKWQLLKHIAFLNSYGD